MNLFKQYFVWALSVAAVPVMAQKAMHLKPLKSVAIAIAEPSDICFSASTNTFFIVSDNGIVFETDADAKIIKQAKEPNCDYEAVFADDQFVYAVDETHRDIHIYDKISLKPLRTVNVPYSGGRNKGYEAFTFNKSKNIFIVITERNPVTLFELDADFKATNHIDLSGIARDISAATYYNDALWLLSDEDMTLLKINPFTYEVLAKWALPVINPEGIAFDAQGNLMVTCDDMQRLYYFNNPEKQ